MVPVSECCQAKQEGKMGSGLENACTTIEFDSTPPIAGPAENPNAEDTDAEEPEAESEDAEEPAAESEDAEEPAEMEDAEEPAAESEDAEGEWALESWGSWKANFKAW